MIGPLTDDVIEAATVDAVRRALAEDVDDRGDVTAALVPASAIGHLAITAREAGVVAGTRCAVAAFAEVDPALVVTWHCPDGTTIAPGDLVAEVHGSFRSILTAERTALNFLGHLSGIASLTAQFVAAVHAANPHTAVLDTRKTTPLLRILEKAAVVAGGGKNHRMGLSDAVLIKDNHLGAMSVTEAVHRSKELHPSLEVEVECDMVDQALEAVAAGAEAVLLDNMSPEQVAEAVLAIRSAGGTSTRIEVSGGVTLATAPRYAAAGADWISVGALTHSSRVLDFGLDLMTESASPMRENDPCS
jgi:nicotinate-nucleotide pyrophosphorylase (carboxylating)